VSRLSHVSVFAAAGGPLPAGDGGYFRLLPYAISRSLIRRINAADHRPAVFYFHPWELDPGQPRIAGTSVKTRFRHYLNLHRTAPRLRKPLRDFKWRRIDRVFLDAPWCRRFLQSPEAEVIEMLEWPALCSCAGLNCRP
jgi:hypothetical protein